ncbi:MAG: hypothetical protein ACTHMG_12460 [Sphingomonas sp.]
MSLEAAACSALAEIEGGLEDDPETVAAFPPAVGRLASSAFPQAESAVAASSAARQESRFFGIMVL